METKFTILVNKDHGYIASIYQNEVLLMYSNGTIVTLPYHGGMFQGTDGHMYIVETEYHGHEDGPKVYRAVLVENVEIEEG